MISLSNMSAAFFLFVIVDLECAQAQPVCGDANDPFSGVTQTLELSKQFAAYLAEATSTHDDMEQCDAYENALEVLKQQLDISVACGAATSQQLEIKSAIRSTRQMMAPPCKRARQEDDSSEDSSGESTSEDDPLADTHIEIGQ